MAAKKLFAVFALVLCIAYFAECGVIETNETGDSGKCNQQQDYRIKTCVVPTSATVAQNTMIA